MDSKHLLYCVVLFCCTFLLHVAKSCNTEELVGEVLACFDEKGAIIEDFDRRALSTNVECSVQIKSGVSFYKCNGTSWQQNTDSVLKPDRPNLRRKRGFWRSIGRFFRSVGEGIACVVTLFSCLWNRPHPRDNTQPALKCPKVQPALAEPFHTYAKIEWTEPVARDETDGTITPRRYGRAPGRHFPEGSHTVTYIAKDKSGNSATCVVHIEARVVRCPPPSAVPDGYFICHPSTDFVRGGICRYGCYDGFDLEGDSVLTCQDSGFWSSQRQPTCKPWKCPALKSIDGAGLPICSNDYFFRSICSYNCNLPGYDMPPRVGKTLVCSISKSWRKSGEARCIDVEPPSFATCPSTVVSGTDTGVNTSKVFWKTPTGKDNSQKPVTIAIRSGPSLNSKLPAGNYDVRYGLKDETGNEGNDCTFSVIVRDVKCSRIYPTPYVRVRCPSGYRTGSFCNFTCDPGKTLFGSDFVTCDKSTKGLYGKWNWFGGLQTVCKNTHTCAAMQPPKNGALACDNWMGGEFCQAQCRNGTEMSSVSLGKLYVCNTDGDWNPPPTFRQCKAVRTSYHHSVSLSVYFYYDGDCTSDATKHQIAENFIHGLQTNVLFQPEVCPDDTECNYDNVQVFCGEVERRKRSANITEHMRLSITVKLPVNQTTPNGNIFDMQKEYKDTIASFTSFISTNDSVLSDFPVALINVTSNGIIVECETGSVRSEESLNCIDCPEGTFYKDSHNGQDATCELCYKGTYQYQAGHTTCNSCPHGTTTHSTGSQSIAECEEACLPGQYSNDGLHPCSPCDIGHYQSSYGQMYCRRCRGSKSTSTFGSSSITDCHEFDISANNDNNDRNVTVSLSLQNPTIFNDFTIQMWIRITRHSTLDDPQLTITLSDVHGEALWSFSAMRNVIIGNRKTTMDLRPLDNDWHHLAIFNTNCNSTGYFDGLGILADSFFGQCSTMNVTSITLTTGINTSVSMTHLNVWKGKKDSKHGRCHSSEKGDVFNWQDFDDAVLDDGAYMNVPSKCDDFDNCVSSPCANGNCSDGPNDFSCACDKGFTGNQCDFNLDDCEINVCMNGATCIDGINAYSCVCKANYTGQFCEIEMVDGQWSDWSNWSDCSTTCGDGTMQRQRLCNNPTPGNGGSYCIGEIYDFMTCNNTECPVCPQLSALRNGSIDCNNNVHSVNCTIDCDEGYDFDIEPMDKYFCGPETFHIWNFETDSNPERRLPKCVEIHMPEELSIHYSAKYKDLYCVNEELVSTASDEISTTVFTIMSTIPCVRKKTCSASSVVVTNCDAHTRNRRDARTAGFSVTISGQPKSDNDSDAISELEAAFDNIKGAIANGEFTVDILDDEYEIDINKTDVSGEALCAPGQTRVNFYCVACGTGSYLFGDYCKPCIKGTYQVLEGQTSCIVCPSGKSTTGEGSDSIEDCSVEILVKEYTGVKVTGIVVGCVTGVVAVVMVIFIYRRYRSTVRKANTITDINMAHTTLEGTLGPSIIRFKATDVSTELPDNNKVNRNI